MEAFASDEADWDVHIHKRRSMKLFQLDKPNEMRTGLTFVCVQSGVDWML